MMIIHHMMNYIEHIFQDLKQNHKLVVNLIKVVKVMFHKKIKIKEVV